MSFRSATGPRLVAVMGPTASGKTDLAERLADLLDAQLISADAFQIYRGFDVGTAKPGNPGRYELVDILDANEPYGVGEFIRRAEPLLRTYYLKSRNVVLVGGTTYYLRALLEEYDGLHGPPDPGLRASLQARLRAEGLEVLAGELVARSPDLAQRTDLRNPARVTRALEIAYDPVPPLRFTLPQFRVSKICLDPEATELKGRIVARINRMMQNGWVAEVVGLRKQGVSLSDPAMRAIGYGALWRYCDGERSLDETVELVVNETAQYAKRQRTWMRKEPRVERFAGFGNTEEAFGFALERLK